MDKCKEQLPKDRRGYYSEILTNFEVEDRSTAEYGTPKTGAPTVSPTKWQIYTVKHTPIIRSLSKPETFCALAPAERWMYFEHEKRICFPAETFKPRVQMMYTHVPKQLPRSVEVERRRRAYLAKNIVDCLVKLNIPNHQLIPTSIIWPLERNRDFKEQLGRHYLPLEIFDNEEYDTRMPQGWMDIGLIDGIRHPIPGTAFLPCKDTVLDDDTVTITDESVNTWFEWMDVAVTDFDHSTKLFSVLTLDGFQREYFIPRIYLMFKAEDPELFASRIKFAVDYRTECAQIIRLQFGLDCMILTGTYEIEDALLDKIFKMATRNGKIKLVEDDSLKTLEAQVRLNHKRCLGELQFECKTTMYSAHELLVLCKAASQIDYKPAPEKGCVSVPPYNFKEHCDYRHWVSICIFPDVYLALKAIVNENFTVEKMSLFTASYVKQLPIEEFEKVQLQATKNILPVHALQLMRSIHQINIVTKVYSKHSTDYYYYSALEYFL